MQRIAESAFVAYDSNCLVYYCFLVEIPETTPRICVKAIYTPQARSLTEFIISNGQKIITFTRAYDELRECIYAAVTERMTHRDIEALYGCEYGVHLSDKEKLRVLTSVEKKVRKLQNNSWFVIDKTFVPNADELRKIEAFFASQKPEDFGTSMIPSPMDREFINFGLTKTVPLITNDGGISKFARQLQGQGLAYRIFNLLELNS